MACLKPLFILLFCLLVASSLSAQVYKPLPPGSSIALLPPGGDAEASGLRSTTIEAAVKALRSRSYLVIEPELVDEELRLARRGSCGALAACNSDEVLDALGVDAVASVVVWLDEDGERPDHVYVNLTRRKNWGESEVTIGKQGLDRAVGSAMALALEDALARHHVVLRVETTPDNAQVEVDHRGVGKAPAETKVLPGKRVVTVSAKGYETVSSYVDVPPSTVGQYIYKIKLAQSDRRAPGLDKAKIQENDDLSIDRFGSTASAWNYVIGSGLLAASAALFTPALFNAVNEGDCYEEDEHGRCIRYVFGVQSTLMMLGGVFALGGGLAFVFFEPIAADPSVRVGVNPTSIVLASEF